MNHQELLSCSLLALNNYQNDCQEETEYLQGFLSQYNRLDETDKNFVVEVFSGCIKHDPALKIVVDIFYKTDGRNCRNVDRNLYKVLVYLMLFRLDELGMSHFRKFVASQDTNKMHKFLSYFVDETNVKTNLFIEWCKLYEHSYVQINLLSPLLRWLPELTELCSRLSDKVNNKTKPRSVKAATEVKSFNLTQPRPRSIPVPERIPKLQKHRTPPETMYKTPVEMEKLEKIKEKNRKAAEKRLIHSSMRQFSCASAEKSDKTRQRMQQYIDEENAKLKFEKHKASPFRSVSNNDKPIRLNAATILREGVLFRKKEEEEKKKLSDYAMGGRDASEFMKWQREMKERDLEKQLVEIERRRLEGKLSYEEAILARQSLIKENKEKVQEIKKETKEIMQEYLEEKFKKEKEMRNLVEQTMLDEKNAKEAQKKLQQYKQSIVKEVNKESQGLMQKALEEAEEEMRQKVALIAKIRAIESVPVLRFKLVDLTETSGAGLLGEMSVVELRERLALLKAAQKEDEETKRNEILQSKVDRDQFLMDTLESIAKHRAEKGKEHAVRSSAKKQTESRKTNDAKVLELQGRLEAKRIERQKEKERLSLSPQKQSARQKQLTKEKKTLEEMRWQELERSRERTVKLRTSNPKEKSRLQLVSF